MSRRLSRSSLPLLLAAALAAGLAGCGGAPGDTPPAGAPTTAPTTAPPTAPAAATSPPEPAGPAARAATPTPAPPAPPTATPAPAPPTADADGGGRESGASEGAQPVSLCWKGPATPRSALPDIERGCAFDAVPAPGGSRTGTLAHLDLRVWQDVDEYESIYISARPADGSWSTLGTVPLPLDDGLSASGRFRYGELSLDVPLAGEDPPLTIEVRLWQEIDGRWGHYTQDVLEARGLYVGARPAGGSWDMLGMIPLPLERRLGSPATFHYGDITLDVPPRDGGVDPLPGIAIEFETGFSADEQSRWRRWVEEEFAITATYFARRYGLTAPGLRMLVLNPELGTGQGRYASGTIYLTPWFVKAIAHEYVHALQDVLSGGARAPRWMMEGVAVYFEGLYDDATGWWGMDDRLRADQRNASGVRGSLRDIETGIRTSDNEAYSLGHLAVRRLVELAGDAALWDFHGRLSGGVSWETAFEEAFGVAVDDFYEAFATYRAEVAPALPHIQGVVRGPDGERAAGVGVWALTLDTGTRKLDRTREDGTYSVAAASGSYRLSVTHQECGTMRSFDEEAWRRGLRLKHDPIVVEAEDVTGVDIRLENDPTAPCRAAQGAYWAPAE